MVGSHGIFLHDLFVHLIDDVIVFIDEVLNRIKIFLCIERSIDRRCCRRDIVQCDRQTVLRERIRRLFELLSTNRVLSVLSFTTKCSIL